MERLMEYVMETYGYLITEKDGKKSVDNAAIEFLDLTNQEKAFIRLTFRTYNILITERQKDEPITAKNRSDKVSDYDYGKISSNGMQAMDKPVIAKIEYEGEEIVFEDYDALDDFIIHEFIPSKVVMKVNKSRNYKGKETDKPYPSIQLNEIVKLRLSEKEVDRVVDVLYKNGIRIGGTSQDMDSEFLNYDYIHTYATKRFPKPLTKEEEHEKFSEYQRTKDKDLFEELYVRNLRLVPYVAWRLALRHNVDQEDLESYGYEGLMDAVKNYDPFMNAKFATYAIPCISGFMKRSIAKMKNIYPSYYYEFQNVRYIVEKEWGKKYDGDPEMLEEILDVLIAQRIISPAKRSDMRRLFGIPLSIDELRENGQEVVSELIEREIDATSFDKNIKESLLSALDTLTVREVKVLESLYGLVDGKEKTLKEVGKELFVSPARVHTIEKKALRKLRHPFRSKDLRELYFSENNENGDYYVVNVSDEGDKHK